MLQQNQAAETALMRARIDLMAQDKWTFFAALILFMKTELDTDPNVDTLAVNPTTIWINGQFFVNLPKNQRITALAHEALHPALKHLFRCELGNFDPSLYNDAGDHVINLMLTDAGFEPIPGWLCDSRFKGMTTEQVYQILRSEQVAQPQPSPAQGGSGNQQGQGSGQSNPLGKDMIQSKPEPKPGDEKGNDQGDCAGTLAEHKQHVDMVLQQAAQMVQMKGLDPGCIPADIQVYLDGLLKPKLPMAQHLRRFFQNMAKNDYSWRRINRRFKPMMLPGMWSEKLSNIAFAFDMSGSVSDADTKRYVSEMYHVMRMLKPDMLTLIQFDTKIKSVEKIKSVRDMMNVKLVGRGGTDIEDLMQWARKHKPTALVVFTDGEYRHPSFNPGCPILWMIHGRRREHFHCDFGTTIKFEV